MKTLLALVLLALTATIALSQAGKSQPAKLEVVYDRTTDRTTVKLLPVELSGAKDRYHSLHMSPSFSYPGRQPKAPAFIDFELQTVVKGRLRTDLYVVFVIEGERVFLSSNRRAVKHPVPGRVWVGEQLVFRMPYETFVRITRAQTFEIRFDAVEFAVGDRQREGLRELLALMQEVSS